MFVWFGHTHGRGNARARDRTRATAVATPDPFTARPPGNSKKYTWKRKGVHRKAEEPQGGRSWGPVITRCPDPEPTTSPRATSSISSLFTQDHVPLLSEKVTQKGLRSLSYRACSGGGGGHTSAMFPAPMAPRPSPRRAPQPHGGLPPNSEPDGGSPDEAVMGVLGHRSWERAAGREASWTCRVASGKGLSFGTSPLQWHPHTRTTGRAREGDPETRDGNSPMRTKPGPRSTLCPSTWHRAWHPAGMQDTC